MDMHEQMAQLDAALDEIMGTYLREGWSVKQAHALVTTMTKQALQDVKTRKLLENNDS